MVMCKTEAATVNQQQNTQKQKIQRSYTIKLNCEYQIKLKYIFHKRKFLISACIKKWQWLTAFFPKKILTLYCPFVYVYE